jgi:hypothetical protein
VEGKPDRRLVEHVVDLVPLVLALVAVVLILYLFA